jgi:thiamine-monophosphate kinase
LDHALGDGEDFELIVAVSPADGQRLIATQPIAGLTLTAIGECVEKGLWLDKEGQRSVLEPRGYVHQLK